MSIRVFDLARDELDYRFDYNEAETALLRDRFGSHKPIEIGDLHRVALWKLNRVLNLPDHVIESLNDVRTASSLSIEDEQSRNVIIRLIECEGVHYPMASSFLKFVRRDVYPIIDVRAYRALTGHQVRSHAYGIDMYMDYARQIREISTVTQVPFHEVDEQLYCFDKKHNGSIWG